MALSDSSRLANDLLTDGFCTLSAQCLRLNCRSKYSSDSLKLLMVWWLECLINFWRHCNWIEVAIWHCCALVLPVPERRVHSDKPELNIELPIRRSPDLIEWINSINKNRIIQFDHGFSARFKWWRKMPNVQVYILVPFWPKIIIW